MDENIFIKKLLDKLTIEEKAGLCHANSKFTIAGVERLGIPELTMSDGPHGVREEIMRDEWKSANRDDDFCTYLPTGSALCSTWNRSLAHLFGTVLGSEARYRKKDVILGPGINVMRTPLCGRNFEYYSEDPYLIGKMVAPTVKGIQSEGTASCLKHYALNNQELDRMNVEVEVSDRALHEIYLPGFKSAVKEGKVYSVMGAYNRYKGEFCCHNSHLNRILKDEWEFDGVFMSDWAGAHTTNDSVAFGLDVEMGTNKPYNEFYLADEFIKMAKDDPEVEKILNDKAERVLRLMYRVGIFDKHRKQGEFNTKEHQKSAYDIASEAMVLLKNDGILPLNTNDLKNILVVGENAVKVHAHGGNSSGVKAFYEITPLEGIKNKFGGCVKYMSGIENKDTVIPMELLNIIDEGAGCKGWKKEVFKLGETQPIEVTYCDAPILNITEDDEIAGIKADNLYFRFTAKYTVVNEHTNFILKADKGAKFYADGGLQRDVSDVEGIAASNISLRYPEGRIIELRLEYKLEDKNGFAALYWGNDQTQLSDNSKLIEEAKMADAVIFCGGLNHSYDTEGYDRKDIALPDGQDELIEALISVNPNTVVCLTAGSPVAMPWVDRAKAIVWTWYAGMEGGNVLADIIFGKLNPSGKLPVSFPKKLSDCGAHSLGEYKTEKCSYNEGIFVGYRWFDKENISPLFPFGHGLSYTSFAYTDVEAEISKENVIVSCKVKNTGKLTGKEIIQLYVSDKESSLERPKKELKGFEKISLHPGEECCVNFQLTKEDFSFYDDRINSWNFEKGKFDILIGASSYDIRLIKTIEL